MAGLVARGHTCRAVGLALTEAGLASKQAVIAALRSRGLEHESASETAVVYPLDGVQIHAVFDESRFLPYVEQLIAEFAADWLVVSSENAEFKLLRAASKQSSGRVAYLVHTPHLLPFGPDQIAKMPDDAATLVRGADLVLTVSEFMKNYLRRWGDLDSKVIHLPAFGEGPFPRFGGFDSDGAVMMYNPCAYKGGPIFAELARRLPEVKFLAIRGWGTNAADLATLKALLNVRVIEPVDNIDDVMCKARVVLMPSLWLESFGLFCVEAMLRGIPVIASKLGGLPEAKLGVDYVLPVRQISAYDLENFDDRGQPFTTIPPQDVEPWVSTLRLLLTDRREYERVSSDSRVAAERYVLSKCTVDSFEQALLGTSKAHTSA
jgi:glycosyltransferase involved in cell wall biosynthesis